MSTVLKTAAIVVTAAVLIGTGVGLAAGASLATAFSFATVGTLTTLGVSSTVATSILLATAAIDLSMIGQALSPSVSSGQQTQWKADPYAGIPYVMGRTLVSGNIVAKLSKGSNNEFEAFVTVLSLGPINGFETSYMNRTTMVWDGRGQLGGGEATGAYAGFIWEDRQIGACPELTKVGTFAGDGFRSWTDNHKLSGLAACLNVFCTNAQADDNLTSEPKPAWIVEGVKVYDPRLDSTYPGGSGPCRALDEGTYVYSENPHLHGLTWALGRWQNGRRVAGIGAPISTIDVPAFVEGANLDDARGWKLGGQVVTRPDSPWNSLKAMLQAGGAQPLLLGGRISCLNRAPRVTLDTITRADIIGDWSIAATQPRRSRINGIIPSYRSEAHDWEMIAAGRVGISAYEAMDGDERTKDVAYPLVQNADQAAMLAAYDICDSRELGPITLPCKPRWLNYRIGDALLVEPEDGFSVKAIITGRAIDAQTGGVTLTLRGETDGKHPFCLGQTAIVPAIATYHYDEPSANASGDWGLLGTSLTLAGAYVPALVLSGQVSNPKVEEVVIDYRLHADGQAADAGWMGATLAAPTLTRREITGVSPQTAYDVGVRYRVRGAMGARVIFGPVTTGAGYVGSLTATQGANAIIKASFADGSVGGWQNAVAQGNQGPDGSGELQCSARDALEAGNIWPVTPGLEYFVDAWAWTGNAGSHDGTIGLRCTDAAGGNPQWMPGATLAAGHGWTRISGIITIPAGAALAQPWLQNGGEGSGLPYIAWAKLYIGTAQPGADITSAITGPASLSIAADYRGVITDALPRVQPYALIRQGNDVTVSATWSVSVISGALAASIDGGVLSITSSGGAMTSGRVRIVAADGSVVRTMDVTISVNNAAAPYTGTGGGTSASGAINGDTTGVGATMTAVGDELTVIAGSAGTVTLSAQYDFTNPDPVYRSMHYVSAQWYRWNGSAYYPVGDIQPCSSPYALYLGSTGSGSCNYTDTGASYGTSYKYRLYAKRSSSTEQPSHLTGSCSAVGS